MKKVYEHEGFTYYEYKPTIFKPFYMDMELFSLRERVRFLLSHFVGYKVYYMKEGNEYVGDCVVEKGGSGRYKFADKKDIIVGPIFIKDEFRGRKLSSILTDVILLDLGLKYHYAWNYVDKLNASSLKASPKAGFIYFSDALISGIRRQLILVPGDSGEFLVMRRKNMKSL